MLNVNPLLVMYVKYIYSLFVACLFIVFWFWLFLVF